MVAVILLFYYSQRYSYDSMPCQVWAGGKEIVAVVLLCYFSQRYSYGTLPCQVWAGGKEMVAQYASFEAKVKAKARAAA
jgi:hypothetical protein